ncbi:UDP-N-acetylglucosamine 2-epimerase [Halorubrum sp. DM2]|uniref:non-hydrolyzing UDP-N-acetylglucosamine 2-epimerase n=1 Tax=Halorubrum sp. DM2 TaxID=2527867 RepID=UPI0024B81E45|nr:UDP-N-acetylglucosamine 2-epimerase (non-hydrolyzing) [Halorubrum sp. DM2]VTT88045.1 UDP-N-acetylglucosamine 2-epimerase [Halorubrum sp. DM2]
MTTTPHLAIVLGTRPEIVKLAPVVRACERSGHPYTLVHTGQHYSERLDGTFFDQLGLPAPDHHLGVGSGTHGEQTGEMLAGLDGVLRTVDPDVVLVQGDTNSALAGALAAAKLPVELGHVEAGLRSFDREMPEETNRVVADRVADYLFAPTATAATHLRREGTDADRVFITGNTVVDALRRHLDIARTRSRVLDDLGLAAGEFALLTAHRPRNVDDPDRFARLLDGVAAAAAESDLDVVYPVHPRAERQIADLDSLPERVRTVEPQEYLDFLRLEDAARFVMTDSGGVQEEACVLGVPCLTLRENTERPETVEVGANTLVGTDPRAIRNGVRALKADTAEWPNPFGDGSAAERVLDALCGRPTAEPEASR